MLLTKWWVRLAAFILLVIGVHDYLKIFGVTLLW